MDISSLKRKADKLRADVLKMVTNADSGHPGGALGMADFWTVLHYNYLNDKPDDPSWEDRDRFVLSNGHTCPLLYAVLADKGYFDSNELNHLRQLGALLQGHPSTAKGTPGVEFSSGSLGHGLSFSAGVALAGKLDGKEYRTYCSISDAECQEGQTWEAAAVASHKNLGHLLAVVDYNDSQIDGKVSDIQDVAPIAAKWESFGWNVVEIDGHDYEQIDSALQEFTTENGIDDKPTVVISHNTIGKGVSFMEGDHKWHHGSLTDEQMEIALSELGIEN